MNDAFPERDWKTLRDLKPQLLDRLCKRILDELQDVARDTQQSHHERFLEVYSRLHERNQELANAFDGLSRSRAFVKLAQMASLKLLTPEELAQFTPETRQRVKRYNNDPT